MAYPSLPDEVQKTSTRGSSKKPASFTDVIEDTGEIPEPLKPERRRKKPD
jgi:hypothetical protein